ncbi:MAG: PAS domain S-box-containing protein, partial [Woeseiaceae bacterium]
MTRRFWRFSAVALFGIIVVAVTLAISYGRLNIRNLTELSADKNTVLARSLSIAARVQLLALLQQSSDRNLLEIRAAAASSDLPEIMTRQVRELSVFKVNVFNRGGVAVFSTDPALIGIRFPQNPGIVSALNGGSVSDIVRENSLNSFDKVIESHDLIQTYIPFLSDDGTLIGVFEVYSDITPLLTRIAETRRDIVVGVSAILAILYALLVGLYARTDQRLVKEQAATQGYLEQIESAKSTLEVRVAKRTRMLEESRDFLQTAMDGVPDPAIVIDLNYRIKSMNKAARKAFTVDRNTAEPVHCYSAMHGLDVPCGDVGRQCTLKSGLPCKVDENVERPNGDIQHVEFRTTPLRAANGEITGAIEIAHDLNEREQTAFRLRQAQEIAETESRVKSEFVATMSHEIRTPMNAVLGMTDLLRLTHLTRKQQGYIQTIQSSGNMLLSLVDNILDFTKMGAGGALVIQKREFSINELLEGVLEIIGNHAYSKGLELVGFLDLDFDLKVLGDRNRLRQILVNLAGNAVKFSDHGEIVIRIGVESEREGEINLLFSVSDSGIGMTNEVTANIFAPFANVEDQGAETQQGSGLGLAICKQLAEQMGGEIGIDSKPGEGTKVWFTVPVERNTLHDDDPATRSPVLQGKHILTVHRNAVIDQAVCAYAMAEGMSCDIVAKDDAALERLQASANAG